MASVFAVINSYCFSRICRSNFAVGEPAFKKWQSSCAVAVPFLILFSVASIAKAINCCSLPSGVVAGGRFDDLCSSLALDLLIINTLLANQEYIYYPIFYIHLNMFLVYLRCNLLHNTYHLKY